MARWRLGKVSWWINVEGFLFHIMNAWVLLIWNDQPSKSPLFPLSGPFEIITAKTKDIKFLCCEVDISYIYDVNFVPITLSNWPYFVIECERENLWTLPKKKKKPHNILIRNLFWFMVGWNLILLWKYCENSLYS